MEFPGAEEWIPARLLAQALGMTESRHLTHPSMASGFRCAAPE
jgi:hypothetical protein